MGGQLHRCHCIWHYHTKFSHPGKQTPLTQPLSNTTQFPAVYKFCIPHTIKFLKTSARNFRHHAVTAHCVLTSSVPSTLSADQRNGKCLV